MSYQTSDETATALGAFRGRTVTALWVSPDEGELHIVCGHDALTMPTEGDCCSESWWADAIGVKQLIGAEVTGAAEIDMPAIPAGDTRTRQESDEAYGFRVTTTRGVCDLIFRNSSNGYYGGWASYHWHEAYTVPDGYREITEDWSA